MSPAKHTLWIVIGYVCAGLFAMVLLLFWFATGPRDLSRYPLKIRSPLVLPWAPGESHLCIQGNRGVVSHRGLEEFAYDFAMPVSTAVYAARRGRVVKVVVKYDAHGHNYPNNLVVIQHDDATFGYYLHLEKDGSLVKVGDHVEQGQKIALSGNVGNSMMPHLHFHVTDAADKRTIPITFSDVVSGQGVPRMFRSYVAGGSVGAY